MSNPGQIDMSSFNEALQGLNAGNMEKDPSLMKVGSKAKGISNSGIQLNFLSFLCIL